MRNVDLCGGITWFKMIIGKGIIYITKMDLIITFLKKNRVLTTIILCNKSRPLQKKEKSKYVKDELFLQYTK